MGVLKVALVHATAASMRPAHLAFAAAFPEAVLWNLLDDRLVVEADEAGGLTEPLAARMRTLIGHAIGGGADAVLLTCSMYGPVAAATEAAVPVLPSDLALFEAVRDSGAQRVEVLCPLAPAVADTVARLGGAAPGVRIEGTQVEGASGADEHELNALIAAAAARSEADLVVLGQFSLAPAQEAAQAAAKVPVLSAPRLAAERLRSLLVAT
ncbi:hypothetical protein [Glycomyces sp. NPDC047010]|uniref:hypothetical protein n=1 Tax=Glycomyces sp. NPDC047010 TaxID=3155023 RepID=UPI0033EAE30B